MNYQKLKESFESSPEENKERVKKMSAATLKVQEQIVGIILDNCDENLFRVPSLCACIATDLIRLVGHIRGYQQT